MKIRFNIKEAPGPSDTQRAICACRFVCGGLHKVEITRDARKGAWDRLAGIKVKGKCRKRRGNNAGYNVRGGPDSAEMFAYS